MKKKEIKEETHSCECCNHEAETTRNVPVKKTSKLVKFCLGFLIVILLLSTVFAPIILVVTAFFVDSANNNIDYKLKGDQIIISDGAYVVTKEDTVTTDECFVIQSKVERKKDIKRSGISKVFGGTSLNVIYDLYDKDGYILGSAEFYIDNTDVDDKWKTKASYCEVDFKDVDTYKVSSINTY